MTHPKQNLRDVTLGEHVTIYDFVNLYGCEIGDNSKVGTFVEIQKGAKIGRQCQGFQPYLHLRRGDDRGRCIHWTQRLVHQ